MFANVLRNVAISLVPVLGSDVGIGLLCVIWIVPLVSTYNDQFRQLIAKKGYDGLLSTLKKRRDQLEADNKKPVSEAKGG